MTASGAMRVAISGAAGRMGRTLVGACADRPDVECAGALEHQGHDAIGVDAGTLAGTGAIGIEVTDDPGRFLEAVDGVIDFSLPAGTAALAERCRAAGRQIVIGTTGLSPEERARVEACAGDVPVLIAPNMSVGVNVCFHLIENFESNTGRRNGCRDHRSPPPETRWTPPPARRCGWARSSPARSAAIWRSARSTAARATPGCARPRPSVSRRIRGGDMVGEHTVMFAGTGERVEITHRSGSRLNFAHGALRASLWLRDREAGLYDMQDVLGLR